MLKHALVTATTTVLLLAMLTACAEDDQSNSSANKAAETSNAAVAKPAESTSQRSKRPAQVDPKKAEPQTLEAFQSAAIMGQPVDFSSAENVASSLQTIQQEAGAEAANRVESAINYMLVYDLSVGRNKQKLYKKLDGKTPNEILGMSAR